MTSYTTIAGDMWDGIAYKTLGNEMYMSKLIETNPQHADTYIFAAGVVLVIPEVEATSSSSSLPLWKRGQAQ